MNQYLDKVMIERVFKAHGLDAMVIRTEAGHRCGYVRVPEGHPWFGLGFDAPSPVVFPDDSIEDLGDIDLLALFASAMGDEARAEAHLQSVGAQVRVHGGVTFMGQSDWSNLGDAVGEPIPQAGWWMGFDCMHAGDAPDPDSSLRRLFREMHGGEELDIWTDGHAWTTDEVAAECERMAEQVVAAAHLYEVQHAPGKA